MFRLFILFALVSSSILTADDLTTYENQEKGYSIQYPSNWVKEEQEGFDLMVTAPDQTATLNIITGEVPNELNQELYYTLNLKNLLNSNASIEIKDNCRTDLDGIKAYWIEYTRVDQTLIEVIQYMFVANNVGFVITAGSAQENFAKVNATLDKIVHSFKVLEPAQKSAD